MLIEEMITSMREGLGESSLMTTVTDLGELTNREMIERITETPVDLIEEVLSREEILSEKGTKGRTLRI